MSYTLIAAGMTGSATRTALNAVIGDFDLTEARRRFKGLKMTPFGDSTWPQNTIQPELIRLLGVTYIHAEVTTGTGGHAAMGVAGSTIVPFSDLPSVGDNSLYKRADDIHFYAPAFIPIMGGANDNAFNAPSTSPYTLTDEVWTGGTFPYIGYSGPSYVSSLKGMLKKVTEQNPLSKIVFAGRFEYETTKLSAANYAKLQDRAAADQYCCRESGVGYVNTLELFSGYNIANYMSSLAHPNTLGGEVLALAYAKAASLL